MLVETLKQYGNLDLVKNDFSKWYTKNYNSLFKDFINSDIEKQYVIFLKYFRERNMAINIIGDTILIDIIKPELVNESLVKWYDALDLWRITIKQQQNLKFDQLMVRAVAEAMRSLNHDLTILK